MYRSVTIQRLAELDRKHTHQWRIFRYIAHVDGEHVFDVLYVPTEDAARLAKAMMDEPETWGGPIGPVKT
jgi:hypothetical protein